MGFKGLLFVGLGFILSAMLVICYHELQNDTDECYIRSNPFHQEVKIKEWTDSSSDTGRNILDLHLAYSALGSPSPKVGIPAPPSSFPKLEAPSVGGKSARRRLPHSVMHF